MQTPERPRRFLARPVFWLGLAALGLAIPLGARLLEGPPLPVYQTLPDFSLVDQDGQPFDLSRVAGDAWVANFIFTACPTVCPLLTQKMAALEKRSRDLGERVQFVSFSVDPETDTPEVLKAYGARYGRDSGRWSMVTGSVDELGKTISDSFKIAVERQKVPGDRDLDLYEIVHGEHFVLVDGLGRIRGYYRNDDEAHEQLLTDLRRLARNPGGGS